VDDITQPSAILEWLAGGGLIVLIGLVFGVIRRQNTMNDSLLLIRGALIGYEGKGGLVERVSELERRDETVDERIRKAKHDARDEAVERFNAVEFNITSRCDDHEKRIRALEERRRTPRD
jgi:hypothetical protein